MTFVCQYEYCGQEFVARYRDRITYCSNDCYRRDRAGYVLTDGVETHKKCHMCNEILTLDNFHKNAKSYCKECIYLRDSAKKYNVPKELIVSLLEDTECFVCGRTEDLCIDHCHSTGKVRGLLCKPCNKALGFLEDDIERIENLLLYLKHTGEDNG